MKYEQSYTEFEYSVLDLIKNTIPSSFADHLKENGAELAFPQAQELELKVKYDIKEDGRALSLKISWDIEVDEDDNED